MANNPPEGYGDDFLDQILAVPSSYTSLAGTDGTTASQLSSTTGGGGGRSGSSSRRLSPWV